MKTKLVMLTATIALAGLLCFGGNAEADLIYGAETGNVVEYAPSYWGGSNSESEYAYDGGQGFDSAHSSVNNFRGNTDSRAVLLFDSGLTPMLSSNAFVTSDDRRYGAWGTAWAIEQYTYTGTVAKDLTLNVNIQGSLYVDPTIYPSPYGDITSGTRLTADVYIFNSENFGYSHDTGTLIYEMGATVKGSVSFSYDQTGTYDENGQIVFSVNPGETFYLWSKLDTPAQWKPSYSDAGSTLTMNYADPNNLIAGSSNAVPVPPAIWLFGSGLLGLVGVRRKFIK